MSSGNSMALHFLMLPHSLMKSALREKEILLIHFICSSTLELSCHHLVSGTLLWTLILILRSFFPHSFYLSSFYFCFFECFILNLVLSLSCLLYIFLPGYPASTLNIMFECKFLILFSKTTCHPIFPISMHGIIIFTLSLRLRTSMTSMTQISSSPC